MLSASRLSRLLSLIEKAGNALPHPVTLFALLVLSPVALSAIAAQFQIAVTHPGTASRSSRSASSRCPPCIAS